MSRGCLDLAVDNQTRVKSPGLGRIGLALGDRLIWGEP